MASGTRTLLTGRATAETSAGKLLKSRYGAGRVVLTDSGTSALTLALRAASGSGRGPVAVPGYSCYDVATAWMGAGVLPRFYDLDPRTLGPSPSSLRRAVREGVDAVVVAYLYGIALDWERVREAVDEAAGQDFPLLIEDAAQAAGCRWKERPVGSLGDLSVLSFGRGKGWAAGGGGALLALTERGERALARIEGHLELAPAGSLPCLGRAAAQWVFGRPGLYSLPAAMPWLGLGETVYRPPTPPRAASAFTLGALVATHRLLEQELERRRAHATRLREAVEGAPEIEAIRGPAGGFSGELRLPLLADGEARRRLGSREAVRLGVMPGYPSPLHRLPEVRESLDPAVGPGLEGSERLARSLFTAPTHGLLPRRDLEDLADLLQGRETR